MRVGLEVGSQEEPAVTQRNVEPMQLWPNKVVGHMRGQLLRSIARYGIYPTSIVYAIGVGALSPIG